LSHRVFLNPTDCDGKIGAKVSMGKLTDRGARGKLAVGLHDDGDGLYLAVAASGSRSWLFRNTIKGRKSATGNLRDRITLERVCEFSSGHSVLLAPKITKQGVYKSRGYSAAER